MFSAMGRVLLGASLLVMGGSGWAQSTATATGTVKASVIAPIAVIAKEAMDFGILVSSATVGTVVLDPAGTQVTGITRSTQSGPFATGRFAVTGEADYTYAITVPAGSVLLKSDGNSMELKDFRSFGTAGKAETTSSLDGVGAGAFRVGATLVVPANATVGAYTGSYSVTVTYN